MVAERDGAGNHDEPLGESTDEDSDGKAVNGALTEVGSKIQARRRPTAMETKLKAAEAKAGRPKWWRLLRRPM